MSGEIKKEALLSEEENVKEEISFEVEEDGKKGIVVTEKKSLLKKVAGSKPVGFVKKHWKTGLALAAGTAAGFLLGSLGKDGDEGYDESDELEVIDVGDESYNVVEDSEDNEGVESEE